MTTPTSEPLSFEERHHFLLRKLHSLSGIVPIGVFLVEHLLTNSMAFYGGHEKYNESVQFIANLPYLPALEVLGIFLPLAFHALYGIRIAMTAQSNFRAYPYMDNRRYTLQRVTGWIAFFFVIIHLAKFRFAHVMGFAETKFLDSKDFFETTRQGLVEWNLWGTTVPAWLTMTIYVIGLWAACYHFANGIWSFCISWGITVGEKAQKRVGMAAALVGVTLFAWGSLSLYAFARAEARPAAVEAPVAQHAD